MHDSDVLLPSSASPAPPAEPASPAAGGSGRVQNPAGCEECTHLSGQRHTAWLAGDHSKVTDYTVLLRRHWRSVHCA